MRAVRESSEDRAHQGHVAAMERLMEPCCPLWLVGNDSVAAWGGVFNLF